MMKDVNTYWTIPSPEKTVFWRWPKWHALASCGFQVHWLYLSRDADTQAPFSRVSWDDRLGAAGMVQPRFFMCMEQPNSNHSHVFSYLCTMMNDAWKVQMPVSTSIILWNGIQFADLLDLWLLIHKDLWSIVPWSRLESSIKVSMPKWILRILPFTLITLGFMVVMNQKPGAGWVQPAPNIRQAQYPESAGYDHRSLGIAGLEGRPPDFCWLMDG